MGLAVKGGSYITEIKMLQSNPGELQRDFLFKWKTGIQQNNVDSLPQRFLPMHSSVIARPTQEPSKEHEQPSDGCALTCSSRKGAFTAACLVLKIIQWPDMHASMMCQGKQDGGTFCTLSKKRVKLMIILAF